MERRKHNALIACVIFPLAGIALNRHYFHPAYGYYVEQWTLVAVGLISLLFLWQHRPRLAIAFYSNGALVPILIMIAHFAAITSEIALVAYLPAIGIFVLARLTRDVNLILLYTCSVIIASAITGILYESAGLGGVLVLAGGALGVFCADGRGASNREQARLDGIQEQQREIKGAQGQIEEKLAHEKQERQAVRGIF